MNLEFSAGNFAFQTEVRELLQAHRTEDIRCAMYPGMYLLREPEAGEKETASQAYFQMINDVTVTEDHAVVEKKQRGVDAGIDRTIAIGRNQPGVQNMHRQIRDLPGPKSEHQPQL